LGSMAMGSAKFLAIVFPLKGPFLGMNLCCLLIAYQKIQHRR
jgi:hypothetical protein